MKNGVNINGWVIISGWIFKIESRKKKVDLLESCRRQVQLLLEVFTLSGDCPGRCMLNTIDGPSESVEDYLCDPEEMPLGARESRLPCPEDCVLNDWGAWSRCSLVSRRWSGSRRVVDLHKHSTIEKWSCAVLSSAASFFFFIVVCLFLACLPQHI